MGSLGVKTGVRAGSVVVVEDIVLLKDGLSVRTWIGIRCEVRNDAYSGLANMVTVGRQSCSQWAYYIAV